MGRTEEQKQNQAEREAEEGGGNVLKADSEGDRLRDTEEKRGYGKGLTCMREAK